MRRRLLPHSRNGFTLVELMIVVMIIGIILGIAAYFIGILRLVPYMDGQKVSDLQAIHWMEDKGYTNVELLESYRIKPDSDLGCSDVTNAGFRFNATDPEGTTQLDLTTCCLGSYSVDEVRCELISTQI